MSLKRKRSESKKEDKELIEQVRKWEANVLGKQQNLNDVLEILKVAKGASVEASFVAINALGRIFSGLLSKGLMNRTKDSKKLADDAAMQVMAVKILMQLMQHEGANLGRLAGGYDFPNEMLQAVLQTVLASESPSDHLVRTLVDAYIDSYDDVRLYFYRGVARMLAEEVAGDDAVVRNVFAVMTAIRSVPHKDSSEYGSFWVDPPAEADRQQLAVGNAQQHQKAFTEAWLGLMRQRLDVGMYKQILLRLHKRIIPYMAEPRRLMDFLTSAYDAGGPVSLLALNGLYTLIGEHNLNYPLFYEKLYALVDRSLFHVRYRARFFRLLEVFLGSSHLPAYLIAAFIKRITRLALSAPPSGVVVAIPVVYNLLKAHPARQQWQDDPYDALERDPAKCNALQSSLWEMATLQTHYYPNIATLARIFNEPFHKPTFLLEDFLDHTYSTFFESDTARTPKKAPALAVQPPTALFRAGDAVTEFMSF
ncbi:CBF-domain-containing protein [Linderina pennispora]|uniref:CBF-domain-containing protein n=1 Tax=Linderina pennispora TaxID=61395 RepID=A0A1Y1WJD1_9FUNG|nr:CBF-domain-containing protein [Linderina pennispora]ORX73649.1 CBF-domain-containing protein [Linderina pennispora]